MELRYRFARAEIDQEGVVSCVASSDEAVDMGGYRECLSHADGAVDMSSARTVLFNHDRNQPIGGIRACTIKDGRMNADLHISKDARASTGVSILELVRSGAVEGVSIGYAYNDSDAVYENETRTVKVSKWQLREISITPTQADITAKITKRGLPAQFSEPKEHPMSDPVITKEQLEAEQAKARTATLHLDLIKRAKSYGVEIEVEKATDEAHGMRMIADAMRAQIPESKPVAKVPVVEVVKDAADKWIERASNGLLGKRDGSHLSAVEMVRKCAQFDGEDLSEKAPMAVAAHALRRMSFSRDAANKTVSSFSVLTGSTANKQLLAGFDQFAPTWDKFADQRDAVNFNSHNHVGVATGRLVETAENVAFPELVQSEGSYNSQIKMWGATVSVTEQAIVNDELGGIMRSFSRAGYAAARAIERQCYSKLLTATWTSDTMTGVVMATAGDLDKLRRKLKIKLSPSGELMDLEGKILVIDPALRYAAELATGQIYKVDSMVAQGSSKVQGLQIVDSPFVGDTTLLAGALTTDSYLVADPMVADGLIVEFLRGMRAPEIREFDAGAVAAVKFKIMLPFEATVATHTDSAGTARVSGITKGTVA